MRGGNVVYVSCVLLCALFIYNRQEKSTMSGKEIILNLSLGRVHKEID